MKFAVIKTGGKQYRVTEGDVVTIEKLPGEFNAGDPISFNEVVLVDDSKATTVGTPTIKGSVVTAVFVEEGRGDKLRIQKFKSKSNYDKVTGHRQSYNKVKITGIK
jgi:large subunit ribosomal protein L21